MLAFSPVETESTISINCLHLIFPPSPASRGARYRLARPRHTWRQGRARGADDTTGGRASDVKGLFHQATYEHTREGPSCRRRRFFRRRIMQTGQRGARARGREGEDDAYPALTPLITVRHGRRIKFRLSQTAATDGRQGAGGGAGALLPGLDADCAAGAAASRSGSVEATTMARPTFSRPGERNLLTTRGSG